MQKSKNLIVIGSGVFGGAITLELAQRGLRKICVDQVGKAGSGSYALIRPFYSTLDGAKIAWEPDFYL